MSLSTEQRRALFGGAFFIALAVIFPPMEIHGENGVTGVHTMGFLLATPEDRRHTVNVPLLATEVASILAATGLLVLAIRP